MDLRKLKTLIDLVQASGIAEIEINEEGDHVRIVNRPAQAAQAAPAIIEIPQAAPAPAAPAPSAAPAAPSAAPAAQPPQERPKDPKALMASLSKDISELSAPLKKEETPKETKSETKPAPDPIEKFGVKGSDGVILPPEDDLGDPTDPSRTPGIVRSIMLFICLCFVILAAWQVTLFLQPEILKKEPLNTLSQQSCDYLYCPPLRTPVVLSNQVNAISPGQWELKLQIQNQDMRSQKLPVIQLTLEGAGNSRIQKIFEPAEYKTDPKVDLITGGGTANITIPFSFDDGRPTSYKVKVLED